MGLVGVIGVPMLSAVIGGRGVWDCTVPESFNLNFSAVFCYYEKNFCFRLGRGLGTRL